jgi:hypothetical protein
LCDSHSGSNNRWPSDGDVIVIGGTITINGPVTGDVIALGSIITINGPVAGNLRLIGDQVNVNSESQQKCYFVSQ